MKRVILIVLSLFQIESKALLNSRLVERRDSGPSRAAVKIEFFKGKRLLSFCSGALIQRNMLLTAAHCFDKSFIPGFTGFNVVVESFSTGQKKRHVLTGRKFFQHPRYRRHQYGLDHDIAVAFFHGEIPADSAPVSYDMDSKADYSEKKVEVYGYGRSEDYTGRRGEDLWYSNGVLRKAALAIAPGYRNEPTRYLMHMYNSSYLCQGDSGGPQFFVANSIVKIVGVTSGSGGGRALPNGQFSCKGPGAATKVAPYAAWIREKSKGDIQ